MTTTNNTLPAGTTFTALFGDDLWAADVTSELSLDGLTIDAARDAVAEWVEREAVRLADSEDDRIDGDYDVTVYDTDGDEVAEWRGHVDADAAVHRVAGVEYLSAIKLEDGHASGFEYAYSDDDGQWYGLYESDLVLLMEHVNSDDDQRGFSTWCADYSNQSEAIFPPRDDE